MLVDLKDGRCACGGQLKILSVDDSTMDVECTICGDGQTVETDAFNDGGIKYWPQMMANQLEREFEDE